MTLLQFSIKVARGGTAKIIGFEGLQARTERLQELGLHLGVQLIYVGRAPFYGPLLFQTGATVVALREEEAQCLLITPL